MAVLRSLICWGMVAAALAHIATACTRGRDAALQEPRRLVVDRLVAGEAQRLRESALFARDVVAQWQGRLSEIGHSESDCLVPWASLDAQEVDVLELTVPLREQLSARAQVSWSENGNPEVDQHSTTAYGRSSGGGRSTYRFQLGSHPEWRGRRQRICVYLPDASESSGQAEIRALRTRLKQPSKHVFSEPSWRLESDSELWDVALVAPETERRWSLSIPADARLELSLAALSRRPAHARFLLQVIVSGEKHVLLDEVAVSGRPVRWTRHAIDLVHLGARDVELCLSMSVEGGRSALGLVGNPVVTAVPLNPPPPNIVLVSVDTLRADHLSLYGYHRTTSPNLDRWVENGAVVFENAVAPSPWTLPSHLSLFSGLDAISHGVNHAEPVPGGIPLLAEKLRRSGYTTIALTAGGYLDPYWRLDRGFDLYRTVPRSRASDELRLNLDRARALLKELRDQSFFLFFHTYEVHGPYRAREAPWVDRGARQLSDRLSLAYRIGGAKDGYQGTHRLQIADDDGTRASTPEEDRLAVDLYDSGILEVDRHLGELFRALKAEGLHNNTLVVITSDHGESLGDEGLWAHDDLADATLSVPLVFKLPGLNRAQRVQDQVRLIDVAPTLLDLTGHAAGEDQDGMTLRPHLEGEKSARAAWSYAAFENHGVAFTTAEGQRTIFNNTAWPGAWGKSRTSHSQTIGGSREEDTLVRSMFQRLRQSRGIRFELQAGQQQPFRMEIESLGSARSRLKGLGGDCQGVARSSLGFSVDMEAAESCVLHFERTTGWELTIGLQAGTTGGAWSRTLKHSLISKGWAAALCTHGWSEQEVSDSCPAGVRIQWLPAGSLEASEPSPLPPELKEELQALGYVDG